MQEPVIDLEAINDKINDAIDAMHAASPLARVRRIANGSYTGMLADALKLRRPDDKSLTLRENGGYVANSAKFTGESDYLEVSIDLTTGDVAIKCWRGHAQRRPNGNGARITIRMHGRVVFRS